MVSGVAGTGSRFMMYAYPPVRRVQARQADPARMQTENDPKQVRTSADMPSSPWLTGDAGHKARPVPPVNTAVQDGEEQAVPDRFLRRGVDPAEYAVRMRIQYGEPDISGSGDARRVSAEGGKVQEAAEDGECQTCEQRKYQDGSDDMGVSFQTPTRIAPEAAGAMVRKHEQEHVSREQAKAEREDRRVVSQSVTLHTDICPECGKVYISGGTTRTTTASRPEKTEAGGPDETAA